MTRRDHWENVPADTVDDWKAEVANDDTRLGYHDWVEARSEMLASEDGPVTTEASPRRDAVRIRATDRRGNIAYIHRDANRPIRCTLANGVSAALFYAGITTDEMTCRFALDDCETADQALAIVRRYGRSTMAIAMPCRHRAGIARQRPHPHLICSRPYLARSTDWGQSRRTPSARSTRTP